MKNVAKLGKFQPDVIGIEQHRAIRLDLGCGPINQPGFIGIDRFHLSNVSVIADIDRPLPFADNTVDLVLASHSLEHVQDLMATIQEIYRVCKHGAQVCIVAPYYQQMLNLANPYHKQVFNEHTPRFWAKTKSTAVDPKDYFHPSAVEWPLSQSDHSDPGIDFLCVRMEFFYFPEYRNLSPEEQRSARKKHLDVCDQIMYNLVVIKEPMSAEDIKNMESSIEYYESPYITIRRLGETNDRTKQELANIKSNVVLLQDNLDRLKAHSLNVANQLEGMRRNRVYRWMKRFARLDLLQILNPAFQQFLDDSYLFQNLKGFLLQPSANLQEVEFLGYRLEFNRPGLCGIWIAPLLDIPLQRGVVGTELVSPQNKIILRQIVSVNDVREDMPGHFVFAPIPDTEHGIWEIRIFAREVEGPIRLFEWHKYSWGGLGRLNTRAFLGFDFS